MFQHPRLLTLAIAGSAGGYLFAVIASSAPEPAGTVAAFLTIVCAAVVGVAVASMLARA